MFFLLAFHFLLFPQSLCGLFFALKVEFYKRCIFSTMSGYPSFSLGNVNVIDKVESLNSMSTVQSDKYKSLTNIFHFLEIIIKGVKIKEVFASFVEPVCLG
jgi:hypothetical protein